MKPVRSKFGNRTTEDIAEANYNVGYYKGGTDQAFEDGKKLGEILNKQNK